MLSLVRGNAQITILVELRRAFYGRFAHAFRRTVLDKELEQNTPEETSPKKEPTPQQIDPPTPSYVKRKKLKAVLWTMVGITGAGVLTLGIISFLGNSFGSFTVKLQRDPDASLEMGTILQSNDRGIGLKSASTYLDANGMVSNATIAADSLPSKEILDADITVDNYDTVMNQKKIAAANAANLGGSDTSSSDREGVYFNYTFYLRNISSEQVTYSIKMAATSVTKPTNLYDESGNKVSVELEKFVRIRVYENVYSPTGSISHDQKTYAYPATRTGTPLPEYVSDPASTNPESSAVCENFSDWQSDKFTVFDYNDKVLPGDAIIRYSVVMWFEGFDPDTEKVAMPQGGALAFGIDIQGRKSSASSSSEESK